MASGSSLRSHSRCLAPGHIYRWSMASTRKPHAGKRFDPTPPRHRPLDDARLRRCHNRCLPGSTHSGSTNQVSSERVAMRVVPELLARISFSSSAPSLVVNGTLNALAMAGLRNRLMPLLQSPAVLSQRPDGVGGDTIRRALVRRLPST